MGSFSNYAEAKILDHIVGKTSFTMPANVYMALYTDVPSDAGGGTECSGGDYARVECSDDWNAAAAGSIDNANDIDFVEASAAWGDVTSFALLDALTDGNFLAWGTLTATKTVASGNTAKFLAGELTITLD